MARLSALGVWTASIASASLAPTPLALIRVRKLSLSSVSAKPNSVSESSRTTISVWTRASSPTLRPDSVVGVAWILMPTPPVSMTA